MKNPSSPKIIADYMNIVGEGPIWHALDKLLYWVDIVRSQIFWYNPINHSHGLFFQGSENIGGLTIQEDGALLLFMEEGRIGILKNGKDLSIISDRISTEKGNRFNDVVADPVGRVLCGTMALNSSGNTEPPGTLYSFDLDRKLTPLIKGVTIPNGMGFSLDQKTLYYTETLDYKIYQFDYDLSTGQISNRKTFVEFGEGDGMPDGMTVDSEGFIWSASAGGSKLMRFNLAGEEVHTIEFPAKKVTSVAFGGSNMTDMFVTSIGGDDRDKNGSAAGALFGLDTGIKGIQEFYSKIR